MANSETKARERLGRRRREAEERLSDLRRAVDRELGTWAPKRAVWAIPLVAFACGLAAAVATGRRRKKRDE